MSQEISQLILIAEDDSDDRLLYTEAIQQSDQQVGYVFVGSGEELIDYIRNEGNPRPSLIIMDFKMPGMSCSEVITAIDDNPQLNTIPLVIVTGSAINEKAKTWVKPTFVKPTLIKEWINSFNQIVTLYCSNRTRP